MAVIHLYGFCPSMMSWLPKIAGFPMKSADSYGSGVYHHTRRSSICISGEVWWASWCPSCYRRGEERKAPSCHRPWSLSVCRCLTVGMGNITTWFWCWWWTDGMAWKMGEMMGNEAGEGVMGATIWWYVMGMKVACEGDDGIPWNQKSRLLPSFLVKDSFRLITRFWGGRVPYTAHFTWVVYYPIRAAMKSVDDNEARWSVLYSMGLIKGGSHAPCYTKSLPNGSPRMIYSLDIMPIWGSNV